MVTSLFFPTRFASIRAFFYPRLLLAVLLYLLFAFSAHALTLHLPKEGDLIGRIQVIQAPQNLSLGELGRLYDVGVIEMIEANPTVDPWSPLPGSLVVIPTQYILPPGPRKGLVLNLAEMRLYYYHANEPRVTTHPVGIGLKGWSTPLGKAKIIAKKKDPAWYPPESIQQQHAEKGEVLPKIIAAGPENPLGQYAFYLDLPGFLIHGTNRPGGVGVRSSHGCMRLFPEDIESLFYKIPLQTEVRIIHHPYKIGWRQGNLYLEAHQPLSDQTTPLKGSSRLAYLEDALKNALKTKGLPFTQWGFARRIAESALGYPVQLN